MQTQPLSLDSANTRTRKVVAVALLATVCFVYPSALMAVPAEPDGAIPLARSVSLTHGPLSISAFIGDGTYAGSTGDYDWYELVDLNGGWILTVDINAEDFMTPTPLDSVVFVYDSAGTLLATNDDFSPPNKDSYLEFVLPKDDTYYVVVASTGCGPQADPFDPASGLCDPMIWTNGPYFVTLAVSGIHP